MAGFARGHPLQRPHEDVQAAGEVDQLGRTLDRNALAAQQLVPLDLDRQALAELGFIVVNIDGRGTPGRSKSFHDSYYGAMGRDNTVPDQVAGMQDLARRYPWIDIDKAAMWGHSGGGFITADAMFRFPDFFKVGIAESGNHDQRNYEDDWGNVTRACWCATPTARTTTPPRQTSSRRRT